jgi:hypothetical protein
MVGGVGGEWAKETDVMPAGTYASASDDDNRQPQRHRWDGYPAAVVLALDV